VENPPAPEPTPRDEPSFSARESRSRAPRSRAPRSGRVNGTRRTSPPRASIPAFVVIRIDFGLRELSATAAGMPDTSFSVFVEEVLPTRRQAEDAVSRLNALHGSVSRRFFWQYSRLATAEIASPVLPLAEPVTTNPSARDENRWAWLVANMSRTRMNARLFARVAAIRLAALWRARAQVWLAALRQHWRSRDWPRAWTSLASSPRLHRTARSLRLRASIVLVARAAKRYSRSRGYPVSVDWFGAYDIDPRHLVFWLRVKTDQEKQELERYDSYWTHLRSLLARYRYPIEARDGVFFGVESQESLAREFKGHWLPQLE
jgi:hypothetical protein